MKTALITGCSTGFGRRLVPDLLGRGWTVLATLRNAGARESIFADEQKQYGDRLIILSLDVTIAAERAEATRRVEALGGLDCLVNNAGHALFGALEDLTEAQLRSQLEVNFFGAVLLTQNLLPSLRKKKGALINVSSVFGYTGNPLTSAYCASKFALGGLSESLVHELEPHGVRVMRVEPSGHRTSFADNVVWGEGAAPEYALQTRNYRALRARLLSRKGTPPDRVTRRIAALVDRGGRLPARLPVGPGAVLGDWFMRLVPEWIRRPILRRAYRKIFLAEAPARAATGEAA